MVVFLLKSAFDCEQGDSHSHATVMSPNHEREIELGEYMNESSSYHEGINVDRYPGNGYDNPYDDGNNAGYNAPSYYGHNQLVPAPQIDCTKVTALNKPLMEQSMDSNNWRGKHPSTWSHDQAVDWIYSVCKYQKIDCEHVRHGLGDITGEMLVRLRKEDFDSRFSYVGSLIYESLDMELRTYRQDDANSMYQYSPQLEHSSYYNFVENDQPDLNGGINGINISDNVNSMNGCGGPGGIMNSRLEAVIQDQLSGGHTYDTSYLLPGNHLPTNGGGEQIKCEVDSDIDSNQSSSHSFVYSSSIYTQNITPTAHDSTKLQRRKPGRPPSKDKKSKNKNGQRNSRLWEFIRDLLLNPETCPSLLKWENVDEGIFRFVQSDKVARLWGQRKCNPRMTYEKLSRAMRYYYKSQVFQPVIGRRLVYKFGPTATGWKPHPSLVC